MTEEEDATKETAHIVEYLAQNKNVLKASFHSKPHCIEQPHSIILFMIHFSGITHRRTITI